MTWLNFLVPFFTMFRRFLCALLALSSVAIAGHGPYVTILVIDNFNLTNSQKTTKACPRQGFRPICFHLAGEHQLCWRCRWSWVLLYLTIHSIESTPFLSANIAKFVKQGILLENYFSTTHPSEPNYVAVAGGENWGMDNDNLTEIPANVSTIVDLLESKGITWAEYQEGMPSSGFTGFQFLAPNGANRYVRKHKWVITVVHFRDTRYSDILLCSPLIIYNSVANVPARAANIKNFTLFGEDLKNNALPQWMFITPNMSRFLFPLRFLISAIVLHSGRRSWHQRHLCWCLCKPIPYTSP